jgi:hypothetical protein
MRKANTRYKVVIDSNIWVSLLIGKQLKGLNKLLHDELIQIVFCDEQIAELIEVLSRPKFRKYFSSEQVIEFFDLIEDVSVMVKLETEITSCRDKKDNYLLSATIDSKADFLVTGDNDLLEIKNIRYAKIIDFNDFQNLIQKINSRI